CPRLGRVGRGCNLACVTSVYVERRAAAVEIEEVEERAEGVVALRVHVHVHVRGRSVLDGVVVMVMAVAVVGLLLVLNCGSLRLCGGGDWDGPAGVAAADAGGGLCPYE